MSVVEQAVRRRLHRLDQRLRGIALQLDRIVTLENDERLTGQVAPVSDSERRLQDPFDILWRQERMEVSAASELIP
jgi:hypothetical protein